MRTLAKVALAFLALAAAAGSAPAAAIQHVIVIAMENSDVDEVMGDAKSAPYINRELLPQAATASAFTDLLDLPARSEPHYVFLEAGTRSFKDHTFDSNDDPSADNSTASPSHLTRQMRDAGITWMSYQQAMGKETGACPVNSHHPYAAKHNPFVFFRDVAGSPPSPNNTYCAAHHKSYAALASDLASGKLANYVFITPDLCHDMHDNCGGGRVRSGDAWLSRELPGLLRWANANRTLVMVVWDEGHATKFMPFIMAGPGVRQAYVHTAPIDHRSVVLTIEKIFELPPLAAVKDAQDLAPLFESGKIP